MLQVTTAATATEEINCWPPPIPQSPQPGTEGFGETSQGNKTYHQRILSSIKIQ